MNKPVKLMGASSIYGSSDDRDVQEMEIVEKRQANRLDALDKLAEAESRLKNLMQERSKLELDMQKPAIEAEQERKKAEEKAATERIKLEEAVQDKIASVRYEQFNPVEREQKLHADRLALFEQYKNLELGTEKEYNLLKEAEDTRHKKALEEAQMQHYLSNATAFENLLMQYHEAAENSSQVISDTMVGAIDSFVNSFSYAMASAIVQGEKLSDVFKQVGKSMLTHIIGSLIKMGAQMLINSAFATQIQAIQAAAAKITGTAIAAAYAPAAAMASLASFGGNSIPAQAGITATVGLAETMALSGVAHGGIDNIPREGTWLLDGGERVMSPSQNADFTDFLERVNSGSFSSDNGGTVNVHVSDDGLYSSNAIRKLFDALREEAGDKLNVRVITV